MDRLSPPHRPSKVTAEEKKERRWLHSLVSRSGVPPADADDVTQEVLIAVIGSRASFVVPEHQTAERAWRAWCFGVVRRVVFRYWNDRAQDASMQLHADPYAALGASETQAPSPEDEAVLRADLLAAFDVLAELPPESRAVFIAHDIEDESIASAAAVEDVGVNTAWDRLRRARRDVHAATRRQALRTRTERTMRRAPTRHALVVSWDEIASRLARL